MHGIEDIAKLAEKLVSGISVVDPQKRNYPKGVENVSERKIRFHTVNSENEREKRKLFRLFLAYNDRKRQNDSVKPVVRLNIEACLQRKRAEYPFRCKCQRKCHCKERNGQIQLCASIPFVALLLEIKVRIAKKDGKRKRDKNIKVEAVAINVESAVPYYIFYYVNRLTQNTEDRNSEKILKS